MSGGRSPHWIQTYSGVRFDLENPTPDMVRLEDIAHALARTNRFNGHTHGEPYSVAAHSLYVSALCEEQGSISEQGSFNAALAGLLHDSAEAYCGDVARPLKRLIGELYDPVEKRVTRAIAARFRINLGHDERVSLCDALALAWEATHLLPGGMQHDWDPLPPTPTLSNPYSALTWKAAKQIFLARATELGVRS